jgi:hypothetical protein
MPEKHPKRPRDLTMGRKLEEKARDLLKLLDHLEREFSGCGT